MSELTVPWEEHLQAIRRIGRLEGAIEAHRILMGDGAEFADTLLYGLMDDGAMFPLAGDNA